eukprot:4460459-Prymnesium_polylepis.1
MGTSSASVGAHMCMYDHARATLDRLQSTQGSCLSRAVGPVASVARSVDGWSARASRVRASPSTYVPDATEDTRTRRINNTQTVPSGVTRTWSYAPKQADTIVAVCVRVAAGPRGSQGDVHTYLEEYLSEIAAFVSSGVRLDEKKDASWTLARGRARRALGVSFCA